MTKDYLITNGFHCLTHPYRMPKEDEQLSRAVSQLRRGSTMFALLWSEEKDSVEIWTVPNVPPVPENDDDDENPAIPVLA